MKKSKYKKGDIFSMLEIVKPYSSQDKQGKWSHTVVCDCGVVKEVRGSSLSSGQTSSCGCYQRLVSTKHGKSKSPEYAAWRAMLTRVDNKKQAGYKNYGGRGVKVDDDWRDFESFYRDMGDRPTEDHSIDRIDNEKSYSKGNCRWATKREQAQNQRVRQDNKTGVKGVSVESKTGRFVAMAQRNGKRVNLGRFNTLNEAIEAREKQLEVFNNE